MPLPGVAIFWQMASPGDRTVTMDPKCENWWYSFRTFDIILNGLTHVCHLLSVFRNLPHSGVYAVTLTPGCINLHPMAHVLPPPILAFFPESNASSNCANPRCTQQVLIRIFGYVWQCWQTVWPQKRWKHVKAWRINHDSPVDLREERSRYQMQGRTESGHHIPSLHQGSEKDLYWFFDPHVASCQVKKTKYNAYCWILCKEGITTTRRQKLTLQYHINAAHSQCSIFPK